MTTFRTFEEIESWQLARALVNDLYGDSDCGLFARDFALRDQVRRAAVSIMANIAEGFERNGNREFVQFLSIAKASAGECRSLLYIAFDRKYISESQFNERRAQCLLVSGKIQGLIQFLQNSSFRGAKQVGNGQERW